MAFSLSMSFLVGSLALLLLASTGEGKLVLLPAKFSPNYYKKTCPDVQNVVRTVMARRVDMAPAILRLFFHDCFVNGCDASVLLDRTDSMESEKDAEPANKSLAGFDVVDEIKAALEHECPATVSCADILALASRDAVALLGGPSWGRGLDARDLNALSGAHTVGKAHSCDNYRDRVYGDEGANIDPSFAALRRHSCEQGSGEAPFDEKTPTVFDNRYFQDLLARRGLLTSDQELHTDGGPVSDLVELYATNRKAFFADFAEAMVKMGDMRPPMLMPVEVRLNCRMVNY
uniref:Peroxidase n=1 Tax=Oryza brachyantha TaxID=4533 RepID=J3MEK5_ORYBR